MPRPPPSSHDGVASQQYHPPHRANVPPLAARDGGADDNDAASSGSLIGSIGNIRINPPYAIAYALFIAFAFWRSYVEPDGASMEILSKFLDNPQNPTGINELFVTIFNLLGLYAVPFACLLVPGSSNDDRRSPLPATPFVLGSMLGGYGILGLYASFRDPPSSNDVVVPYKGSDLGWFARNVLENKAFNALVVLACVSACVTSGFVHSLLTNPEALILGYTEIFDTAIVSVSSLDFVVLTIVAASYVPEDMRRRGGYDGKINDLIAASTILLPGLGIALYCALRPSLDEE